MTTSRIEFSEGQGLNIASHSFTEDGVVKHTERIAAGAGVAGALAEVTVTTVGLIPAFSVLTAGKGRIIIGAKAVTGAGDYCSFFLVYKNPEGAVIGTSPLIQAICSLYTDGGEPNYRFMNVTVFSNDVGATSVEIYMAVLPSVNSVILMATAV